MIAIVLVVLIPVRRDMERRIATQEPDQLSLTYLQLAVGEAPGDWKLRLLLARQYHEMSRYGDAMATLAPLLSENSPAGHRARLLAIEVAHARCTGRDGKPTTPRCSIELVRDIRALIASGESLSMAERERLAAISLAHGAPALAGDLYDRLATDSGEATTRARWRDVAASAYIQGERPDRAAAVHVRSALAATEPETAEHHVELAVEQFRAAERGDEALALVLAELERAPSSVVLLQRGVDLALANGQPELAARLGRRLLAIGPATKRQWPDSWLWSWVSAMSSELCHWLAVWSRWPPKTTPLG